MIRLNRKDFDGWKQAYHAIPDLTAELTSLDGWARGLPEDKRKKWFQSVSGALNRKHQELLAARSQAGADTSPNAELYRLAANYRR